MGDKVVFSALLELFPQIDIRILKSAAIEHSKDVELAVEFIVNEVLPCTEIMPEKSVRNNQGVACPYVGVKLQDVSPSLKPQEADFVAEDSCDPDHLSDSLWSQPHGFDDDDDDDDQVRLYLDTETNGLVSSMKHRDINFLVDSLQCQSTEPSSMTYEFPSVPDRCNHLPCLEALKVNRDAPVSVDDCRKDEDHLNLDTLPAEEQSSRMTVPNFPIKEGRPDCLRYEALAEKDIEISRSESEEHWSENLVGNGAEKLSFEFESSPKEVDHEPHPTAIATQSGQILSMDYLEEFVCEAKKNKKALLLAMETVCDMMNEAEFHEKAAENAKVEASRGGLEILAQVEDLRAALLRAKEANDTHAGEIYGEKSILATEARELQSRLLNLSEERDRSLLIIDEMRVSLEARIAAAKEVIAAAEKEKREEEETARKALAEQEVIMDKLVQDSKKLQQEAEENSKLREFLIDRGHVVDGLQGEIAVACEDVKLLKEKHDRHPVTSKTHSPDEKIAILTSSSLSNSSRVSGGGPAMSETFERDKMAGNGEVASSGWCENEDRKAVGKVISLEEEEGWYLFTDEAELYS